MKAPRIIITALVIALVAAACGGSDDAETRQVPSEDGEAKAATAVRTPPAQTESSGTGPATEQLTPVPSDAGVEATWQVVFEDGEPWGPDGHGEGSYWDARMLSSEAGLYILAYREGDDGGFFTSADGVNWSAAPSPPVGEELSTDIAVAWPGGLILGGLDFSSRRPGAWLMESADGATWSEPVDDTGLAGVLRGFLRTDGEAGIWGHISGVVPFGDGWVAAGGTEDGATSWTSADGRTWQRHVIASGFASSVGGLTVHDDRLFAVGSSPAMTVWESADGVSWDEVAGPDAFGIQLGGGVDGEGEPGDVILEAPAEGPAETIDEQEVTPGEDEFLEGEELDYEFIEEGFHSGNFAGLATFGDRLVALISVERRRGAAWCFVDASRCNIPALELVTSKDGRTWEMLTLPDDRYLVWQASLAATGESLIIAEAGDGRLQVWAASELGAPQPLPAIEQPQLGFDIVRYGDTVETGVTYGYPFWTHCGIERLGEFNGRVWELIEDRSESIPGEPWTNPSDWNAWGEELYGTLTLVEDDRIEYSVPGGVLGVYAPVENPEQRFCA